MPSSAVCPSLLAIGADAPSSLSLQENTAKSDPTNNADDCEYKDKVNCNDDNDEADCNCFESAEDQFAFMSKYTPCSGRPLDPLGAPPKSRQEG